jgi:vacuolar protein sorting-associated protein 1
LFVATAAFEVLIKQQIKRLEDPCLKCVSTVYDELIRILAQLLQKPIFRRFPGLKDRFNSSVISFFKRGLDPTNKLVSSLVAAETCYINTVHPDFVSGHRTMAIVYDKLQLNTKKDNNPKEGDAKKPPTGTSGGGPMSPVSTYSLDKHNQQPNSNEGIFSSFFSKQPNKRPGILEAPPAVLKASGTVSEREFVEIEVIKLLLTSYYNIVKKTVTDMIPKCIMLNLVNYSREEMQRALLAELYKENLLEDLLKESPDTVIRRKECKKMIEALQKADEIVSTI